MQARHADGLSLGNRQPAAAAPQLLNALHALLIGSLQAGQFPRRDGSFNRSFLWPAEVPPVGRADKIVRFGLSPG